jgi:AcrR family transcriptional regulator
MRTAEATKERILEAALAEFSAHGIAGARVDRIAQAARCNKNLIYIYFTDKETLFTTVLTRHLMRIHEEQPFTPDDLPGYAAKVFDWAMANPDLMRLVAWSALEKAKGPDKRGATLDAKLAALTEAQDACRVEAAFPLISSLSPS